METKVSFIYSYLKSLYPHTKVFLNYTKDYEFLFAVILSAQTTDQKVNEATKKLFKDCPRLIDYNENNLDIITSDIKSLGLFKNKSKNIIKCAAILKEKYNGLVPLNRDELLLLPGVGKKTSGVVLNQLSKTNYFPVDTHIYRISKRLNLINNETPDECEKVLEKTFKDYDCYYLHHAFILFGREICHAKKPSCQNCKLFNLCSFVTNKL